MSEHIKEPFLPVLRELARAFQMFEQFSAHHIRQTELTPPQFDVVATLGNTPGMTCKELSEKTLITKGTLTGVLDRLADKGIVTRQSLPHDRRSVFIALTEAGQALFDRTFPAHLAYMRPAFAAFSQADLDRLHDDLNHLREAFAGALEQQKS